MNIIKRYEKLVKRGKWQEALPIIEEIVSRSPEMATSRFNYGVCLEALGRHADATAQFLYAYRLRPDDYHAQFRAFRSLSLSEDWQGFLRFAEHESEAMPEIVDLLFEDPDFSKVVARPEFAEFRQRNGR